MSDPIATKICEQLRASGYGKALIDQDLNPAVYYSTPDPQKCYATAIKAAEDDAIKYGRLLLKLEKTRSRKIKSSIWRELVAFKKKIDNEGELGRFKRSIPWLFTDFDPSTKFDDKLFARILRGVKAASGAKFPAGEIYMLVRLPKDRGIHIDNVARSTEAEPTKNNIEFTAPEAFKAGYGDCSEYAYAYYGSIAMTGGMLSARIFAASMDTGEHLIVAVRRPGDKGDRMLFADFAQNEPFVRKKRANEVPITPLQLLAEYYGNRALDHLPGLSEDGQLEYREKMFMTALRYDPLNGRVHYNLGRLYQDHGLFGKAEASYKFALRRGFRRPDTLYNLAIVYTEEGRYGLAADTYENHLRLEPRSKERPEIEQKIKTLRGITSASSRAWWRTE